ncbi:MAG: DUF4389 domain-containing protein [Dehalococcoidia bacterium]
MAAYPVTFDIAPPEKFQRPHIVIRILLLFISSFIGNILSYVLFLPYLLFPIASAIFISQKGADRFMQEDAPRIAGWLRWLMCLYAYLFLITDQVVFAQDSQQILRFEVQPRGSPTTGAALLRLVYSIPSALVLGLIGIVVPVLWLVAAVFVLIRESYPQGIYGFFRGYLRWQARLMGYHASLVDQYPPFALRTQAEPT